MAISPYQCAVHVPSTVNLLGNAHWGKRNGHGCMPDALIDGLVGATYLAYYFQRLYVAPPLRLFGVIHYSTCSMTPVALPDEKEEEIKISETSTLTVPRVERVYMRNGEQSLQKEPRRLSFHESVGQMSLNPAGRNRVNGSRPSNSWRGSRLLEVPFAAALAQPPNYPDSVRGENLKYISQRSSFDSAVLCQIIWVFCCVGWVTGLVEILIQTIAYINNSLNWRWSIGFWSGSVFFTHATVGFLTLWRRLRVPVRTVLTETYLGLCVVLAICCVAEMTCAVLTYSGASEWINRTEADYDFNSTHTERSYRVSSVEVSIFNSLLSGCGLLGILIAIFAAAVTLQRLNIELKLAASFSNLVSRRNSAMPPTMSSNGDKLRKSTLNIPATSDEAEV